MSWYGNDMKDGVAVYRESHPETEADKASTSLKRTIFESELGIGHKMHLRGFAETIDDVADWAEDVADRLAIYVIKRTV